MSGLDYRTFIVDELEARRERNPRYSLRAFARDLELPADQLSSVLKRRYGLSRRRAEDIAERLGLSGDERRFFCNLVEAEHGRSPTARQAAKVALDLGQAKSGDSLLGIDEFKLIADWYHFAILELTELDGGHVSVATIPGRLGLSARTANDAVARLLRLGLITRERGKLRATAQETFAPKGIADRSKRRFLGQLGAKALVALDEQPFNEREFSSDMFALAKTDLPEIKRLVQELRRGLAKAALAPGKKDALYCLNVQFFKLGE